MIMPDAHLVVYRSNLLFSAQHPSVTNKVGPFDFGLSGAGDEIRIYDASGSLLESVRYEDSENWPQEADGLGATLEYAGVGPVNEGSSWIAGCPGGSPGEAYDFSCSPCLPPNGLSADAVVNSVDLNWMPSPANDAWQIQGRPLGAASFVGLFAFESSKTVGGLTPSTSYEWRVRSRCLSGAVSEFSALDTFTTAALRTPEKKFLDLGVYPNPTSDWLYLIAGPELEAAIDVEIVDLNGRIVKSLQAEVFPHRTAVRIDLSDLNKGLYTLVARTDIDRQRIQFTLFRP